MKKHILDELDYIFNKESEEMYVKSQHQTDPHAKKFVVYGGVKDPGKFIKWFLENRMNNKNNGGE